MKPQPSRSLTAASLLLLAIGLLIRGLAGFLTPAQSLVLRPIMGIQSWIASRFAALRDLATSPSDVAALRQRNAELEAEVARPPPQGSTLPEKVGEGGS